MHVEWGSTNATGTSMFMMIKISTYKSVKDDGIRGWGIYGLNGWGGYGKVSCCFLGDICSKNTGLQGSTLSSSHMTTGFGPFELPTRGLLQKGRDHSPPKFCFVRSPASWFAQKNHKKLSPHVRTGTRLFRVERWQCTKALLRQSSRGAGRTESFTKPRQ